MIDIQLIEGGGPTIVELDETVGDALNRSKTVTAIRLGGRMWEVAPTTLVGVAVVGGVMLRIEPKVDIGRILYFLGFARKPGWRADIVDLAEVDGLLPALAVAFCDQAERALAVGLLQGYAEVDDAGTILRGRLRDQEQLARRFGIAIPLLVRYDDHTTDISENQLLRGAVDLLLRIPVVGPQTRVRLRRLRQLLADVTPPVPGSPRPRWTPSRLNERYQVPLWLADLLLRGNAVDQAAGGVRIGGFLVDMAKVFEDYVTAALTRAFSAHGGWVRPQDRHHLDVAGRVAMKPDIVWYRGGNPVAVIDAKYKAERPAGFPDADLYQMLAYCTALDLAHGHLVYAKGNEVEASHTVRHAGIELHTHALDLSDAPAMLEAQVDALADRIAAVAQDTTTPVER